jgi:hypothetical protein
MDNVRMLNHAHVPLTSGFWAVMPERKLRLSKEARKATAKGNRFQEHLRINARKDEHKALVRRARMPKPFMFIERIEQVHGASKPKAERTASAKKNALKGLVFRTYDRATFDGLIRKSS